MIILNDEVLLDVINSEPKSFKDVEMTLRRQDAFHEKDRVMYCGWEDGL